jgi:hypothetical protein
MNMNNPLSLESVLYLEPNLNSAITTCGNLHQTLPSWVRGCRFYILSWIQIGKNPAVNITDKELH